MSLAYQNLYIFVKVDFVCIDKYDNKVSIIMIFAIIIIL